MNGVVIGINYFFIFDRIEDTKLFFIKFVLELKFFCYFFRIIFNISRSIFF